MKTIGRYIITGLLGRGGMGRVLKAELPVIQKTVAVKLLDPDPLLITLMGADALRHLFIQEAVTLARLQHPHIIGINDFDTQGTQTFYTMDYLANNLGVMLGESYQVELPSRRINTDKALSYTRQILGGLACLHDAGIIHRDIKPFNLLLTARDTIKICDFGLSKMRGERYAGPSNLNVGSPYYAAPEQRADPDGVDPTADLYALGVILYRMLTGRLPGEAPIAPSLLCPDLDPVWDRFILRAMALEPHQRFPSATTMQEALDQLAAHWRRHKEKVCALPTISVTAPSGPRPAAETPGLRSTPLKLGPREAVDQLGLDHLWRPAVYSHNRLHVIHGKVIRDPDNRLLWQQAGSAYPLTWQEAHAYMDDLNQKQFSDIAHWRLPTIAELITLLRPPPQSRELCLPILFDALQQRLWSCDRSSFTAAYYADATLGFVGRQDFSAPCYVRAVCAEIFSAI